MEKRKICYNQAFRNSGLILLLFVVNTLLLTTILFFIHIEISIFHAPIAFLISILEFLLCYRKRATVIQNIASIFLGIIVLVLAIMLVRYTYDISWDGNTYHKTAIGSLKSGWNPVYEHVEDFTIDKGNKINVDNNEDNKLWINHYPKASWIFSATIYSITNNIEASKIITILMIYICFSLIVTYLNKKIHTIWAVILSLLIVINPITVSQVFTYYVDGLLGISLLIVLYCLLVITELRFEKEQENKVESVLKEHWLILGMTLIFIINLKFTGMVYAAIFCFLFYVYWLYKAYKSERFKEYFIKFSLFYIVVVLIATIIVGYSSYVKNIFENGHPFYPLFGKNKVDIITHNQPDNFKNKGTIKKFAISMLGKGSNLHNSYGDNKAKPEMKIPFTIEEKEIKEYAQPDTRLSGFGPLYSGIFIISACIILYSVCDYIRNKKYNILIPYLLILLGMGILVLATDGSWWARYTPYLYWLPIFNIIYLINKKHLVAKIFSGILVSLLIVNLSIIIYANYSINFVSYTTIREEMEEFKKYVNTHEMTEVAIKTTGHEGVKWNIIDININLDEIKYVEKIDKNKEKVYQFFYKRIDIDR